MIEIDSENWVNVQSAAKKLDRSRFTIYKWINHPDVSIRMIEIGDKKFYFLDDLKKTKEIMTQRQLESRFKHEKNN
jgi:hypothetical protein